MGKKKNKDKTNYKTKETNVWDFFIHIADLIYEILTFKKISLTIIFVFCISFLVQSFKSSYIELLQPFYDISSHIEQALTTSLFTIIISILFIVSLIGNFAQKYYYKREIKRLSNERKEIIHGQASGEFSNLNNHHSSKESALNNEARSLFSK